MSKIKPLPPLSRVKELLDYNPETGVFTWKVTRKGMNAGDSAGTKKTKGHLGISIDGVEYYAHRLVYLYMTGEDPGSLQIDHKNRVRNDNRFSNLRIATAKQNRRNSVHKGIAFHKASNKWQAKIEAAGKQRYLGLFDCPLMARLAYLDAKKELHGEFSPYESYLESCIDNAQDGYSEDCVSDYSPA